MKLHLFAWLLLLPAPLFAAEPKLLLEWGRKGDKPGEFYSPIGLAINKADELYVTDLNNSRVQRFSRDGKPLAQFDLPRDTPERKSCIVGGITLDSHGLIYLAFMNQHRIGVYSPEGKLVREWGKRGTADCEFHQPGGMVIRSDRTILVCDQCNHRIQHFTLEGKHLATWGNYGTKPGEFDGLLPRGSRFGGPHFLTQDSKGRLYTTEGARGRIQQFGPDFQFAHSWGSKSDEPGGFGSYKFGSLKEGMGPIGVFVDHRDRVWVSSLNDRVQAFSPEGKFLFGIPDSVDLSHPHGMAVNSLGHFYIADSGNQRILKFEIPDK